MFIKNAWILLVVICTNLRADVEVYDYIMPIEVFYRNISKPDTCWIGYNNVYQGSSPRVATALEKRKKDIQKAELLYNNKLVVIDTLLVSRKLHLSPDSLEFLVPEKLPMDSMEVILDATSDSLQSIGVFTPCPWLDPVEADLMLHHKPLVIKEVVLHDDAGFWSLHFYLFDSALVTVDLDSVVKKFDQADEAFLQKVKKEVNQIGRAIILEEASP